MNRSSLARLTSLFFAPVAAYAQSVARIKQLSIAQPGINNKVWDEMVLAARSIGALKRLEKHVLVYRSLGVLRKTANWLECRTRLSEMI